MTDAYRVAISTAAALSGAAIGVACALRAPTPSRELTWTSAGAGGLGALLAVELTRNSPSSSSFDRALKNIGDWASQRQCAATLGDTSMHLEVERRVIELRGGLDFVCQALHLAARSSYLNGSLLFDEASLEPKETEQLEALLRSCRLADSLVKRTMELILKAKHQNEDPDIQTLEDAHCIVFLEHGLYRPQAGGNTVEMTDLLRRVWRRMGQSARAKAVAMDYTPKILGCLAIAIANEDAPEAFEAAPLVAPRLPAATISVLRTTWSMVDRDRVGSEILERLTQEDPELSESLSNASVARTANIAKAMRMLLDEVDPANMPQFERILYALASLGRKYGRLNSGSLAPLKHALVRSVIAYVPTKEKKRASQAWETLSYAICSIVSPRLVVTDTLAEFSNSTSSALPIPASGTFAGSLAAQGVGLIEMCLKVSALSQGGTSAPAEVLSRTRQARQWFLQSVSEDIHTYCSLVASCIAVVAPADQDSGGQAAWEDAERHKWLKKSAEVPLRIAELCFNLAQTTAPARRFIKRSLQADWVAGARLLQTAAEISLRNVATNLPGARGDDVERLERRFQALREVGHVWEEMTEVS